MKKENECFLEFKEIIERMKGRRYLTTVDQCNEVDGVQGTKKTKKYKLLKHDSIQVDGVILYRIEALRSFANITKGDKGGYIAKESNLSHEGNCWIFDSAEVYGDGKIFGNVQVENMTAS